VIQDKHRKGASSKRSLALFSLNCLSFLDEGEYLSSSFQHLRLTSVSARYEWLMNFTRVFVWSERHPNSFNAMSRVSRLPNTTFHDAKALVIKFESSLVVELVLRCPMKPGKGFISWLGRVTEDILGQKHKTFFFPNQP
jgi:hypothetical protein